MNLTREEKKTSWTSKWKTTKREKSDKFCEQTDKNCMDHRVSVYAAIYALHTLAHARIFIFSYYLYIVTRAHFDVWSYCNEQAQMISNQNCTILRGFQHTSASASPNCLCIWNFFYRLTNLPYVNISDFVIFFDICCGSIDCGRSN